MLRDMRKGARGRAAPPRAPMDRLVCGDVGYGKTEVAMRAAMLAVLAKKQVAVLVPTTVLAAQHERTFRERFKGYPVRVEAISRHEDARGGEADPQGRRRRARSTSSSAPTGCWPPTSPSSDLGLVVVDEEQRFGVAHKERLKKLRKLVDVLTLTATPIPRTLHMSLAGVRDLSIIATPPRGPARHPHLRHEVRPGRGEGGHRDRAEARRAGLLRPQPGPLHRLDGEVPAPSSCPRPASAWPTARWARGKLEKVMSRFVERELDVLLATSIIESGLDIPSANTIIVNRADHFGLAQLYQIRGRVGRSRERAYAYLLVPARRPVTKDARKRLEVLQRFTELGAGFADRHPRPGDPRRRQPARQGPVGPDRGDRLRALHPAAGRGGARAARARRRARRSTPTSQLPVPAFIPDAYMPDVHQRLYFYKRLAQASHRRGAGGDPRRDRGPLRRPARRGRRPLRAHDA